MEGNRGTCLYHLRQVELCCKNKVVGLHLYLSKNVIKKQTLNIFTIFLYYILTLLKVADL